MAIVLPEGIYPSQQKGVEVLHEALLTYLATDSFDEPTVVNIKGGAGAGKSWTTVNALIPTVISTVDDYMKNGKGSKFYGSICMTTTTHQANSVIAKELALAGVTSIDVSTIHSFLAIVPWTGSCISNPPQFKDCGYKLQETMPSGAKGIVFVDEAFRICPNLWAIMQYLYPNYLWICTYDPYQTPPVGYNSSPIDDLDVPEATFTESPRFVNSGELAKLVTALRITVSESQHDYMNTFNKFVNKAYTLTSAKEYGSIIREAIANQAPLPEDYLMVCGTRKQAANYNNAIHRIRRDSGQDIFMSGDPITVEYVIGSQDTPIVQLLRRERKFLAEFIPFDAKGAGKNQDIFKLFHRVYRYKESNTYIVPLFSANEKPPFKLYRECASRGIILIGIRLNFARTVHTAQGMTVPNVFIDINSICAWSNHDMRRRLLYTGASRCSGTLKVVE